LSGVARKGPAGCLGRLKRATFGPFPAQQAPRTTLESPVDAKKGDWNPIALKN